MKLDTATLAVGAASSLGCAVVSGLLEKPAPCQVGFTAFVVLFWLAYASFLGDGPKGDQE